jgi:hypothetical protein
LEKSFFYKGLSGGFYAVSFFPKLENFALASTLSEGFYVVKIDENTN